MERFATGPGVPETALVLITRTARLGNPVRDISEGSGLLAG